jgi:hypothetical protein
MYNGDMKKILSSLVCSILMFGFSSLAGASEFGTVGGRPANPDSNIPHSDAWFIYTLKPGETKNDVIVVKNNGDTEAHVILYPADATPSTDGGFALKQKVEKNDGVGSWIKLSQQDLVIPATKSVEVPFTITIPNDPTLDVGEHAGGIMIELADQQAADASGFLLTMRSGVRVYVTIPGEIIKKLDITTFDTTFNETKKIYIVNLGVKNSGNTSREVSVQTRATVMPPYNYSFLEYFFKEFPFENRFEHFQILRDDTFVFHTELPKLSFGKIKLESSVSYEGDEKMMEAQPIILTVKPDRNLVILFVLTVAFITLAVAFIIIKRYERKKPVKKHKKQKPVRPPGGPKKRKKS